MAREFSKSFYDSKEWKKCRENVLRRDSYLCRYCNNAAKDVHHIIHLTPSNINDTRICLGEDNLISLCGDCHKRLHANERGNAEKILSEITFDENGQPILKN